MQHHRHLVAEHVAHQAAEDAGDHAGQYHDGRMRAHAHGDIAADHGECHQAQTVHQQEDHAQVMQVARDEAGDDRRADGEGEVLRVGDPADRVVAEQYVAGRPATQCRHRAEQADAEQVHAAAHAHDGSGHGLSRDGDQVDGVQQFHDDSPRLRCPRLGRGSSMCAIMGQAWRYLS